jgi:PEP-CTERM motif
MHKVVRSIAWLAPLLLSGGPASATVLHVTVDGSDAIFIAGRTDLLPIPPLDGNQFAFVLERHPFITPEAIVETLPPSIPVSGGDVIRVADLAVGGVSFFNGFGPPLFGPGGNGVDGSNLTSLGGISGYIGPQGPLTGVFLDNSIPSAGPSPATLDFSPAGLGTDFLTLSPALGQVFYIGDGLTSGLVFQEFIAPAGATQIFLGIPDGFGFLGAPGYYDDNDGAYHVRIGVNQVPVPEPATLLLLALGLGGMGLSRAGRRG